MLMTAKTTIAAAIPTNAATGFRGRTRLSELFRIILRRRHGDNHGNIVRKRSRFCRLIQLLLFRRFLRRARHNRTGSRAFSFASTAAGLCPEASALACSRTAASRCASRRTGLRFRRTTGARRASASLFRLRHHRASGICDASGTRAASGRNARHHILTTRRLPLRIPCAVPERAGCRTASRTGRSPSERPRNYTDR